MIFWVYLGTMPFVAAATVLSFIGLIASGLILIKEHFQKK